MKSYSDQEPSKYARSGLEVRIHWNIKQVQAPVTQGEQPRLQWEANEALCFVMQPRNEIIEAVIRSDMTVGDEFAKINNKDTDPVGYAAYQDFRVLAKQLADGWIAERKLP